MGILWLSITPKICAVTSSTGKSALAETNRPPFDLVEAESELVAGFMVEYGSTPYMMFMLGEYVAIATMCAMTTILFLGGWLPPVDLPGEHGGKQEQRHHSRGTRTDEDAGPEAGSHADDSSTSL